MTPLLRSFAWGAYSKLTRGIATDFPIPHKPNPPPVRSFHQGGGGPSPPQWRYSSGVKSIAGERGQKLAAVDFPDAHTPRDGSRSIVDAVPIREGGNGYGADYNLRFLYSSSRH